MAASAELGRSGEDAAADYLTTAGLQIIVRNWRCRYGEVDIIAADGDTIVFVEVKTRSGRGFGTPAEAVTPVKAQRIHRLAGVWLAEQRGPWVPVRFDVVEVIIAHGEGPRLTHLSGAF
ncbi:MAG: YraN family protein [Rhodococcus sp. (in: high G+C Gram-positive bacteria)]